MDIARKPEVGKRRLRRLLYSLIAAAVLVGVSAGVARLKPAAPEVERATVWTDTVRGGPMDIQVRGLGTLVPEQVLWIPAPVDGRVERVLVLPGTAVKQDTLLLVLSNPELQQSALDAEWQLKQAEAQLSSLKAQVENQLLDQKVAAARVKADYRQAELNADKDRQLARFGLGSELNLKLSQARVEELATRNQIETERVKVLANSVPAQLASQQAKIEQLRALDNLKRSQVESLEVRAGADGVLQELPVEVGRRVAAGAILAKVAQPTHLKAQLKIAETQAKDIQLGQKAGIDTRNGIIPGHVMRIDPAVQSGTRTVDVKLDGALPPGAVPELSVDGTIEIVRLESVLHVGRPAFGQPKSTITLFKLANGGKEAVRVQVQLGRASVNTVEILGGLQEGDEVILSDMSRWDGFDRIRLQ